MVINAAATRCTSVMTLTCVLWNLRPSVGETAEVVDQYRQRGKLVV
jgi:hypothetical protein